MTLPDGCRCYMWWRSRDSDAYEDNLAFDENRGRDSNASDFGWEIAGIDPDGIRQY